MNFLQPWMLFALPLAALPVIIHLIHRNRHRSRPWAAMMFLIQANRMNKGMARIRYFLILAMRTLAILTLIFALGRPLMSGRLGGFQMGKPDVTLILLDRSASMESQDLQSGVSRRSSSINQLTQLLEQRGYGSELILIDSATNEYNRIESLEALPELPWTQPTAGSANVPALIESAIAYLKANEVGRADVWLCSDLQSSDWDPDSGRWKSIQAELQSLKGVQTYLLSYAEPVENNLSVRVENPRRVIVDEASELLLDIFVEHSDQGVGTTTGPGGSGSDFPKPPVEIFFQGVRSAVEMDWGKQGASILGHRLPLRDGQYSGWGSVSLPGDTNPMDNRWYFVFSEPPVRNVAIISEDPSVSEIFRKCLTVSMNPGVKNSVISIRPNQVNELDWDSLSLLVWQAKLPGSDLKERIENWVNTGRAALFFPPAQISQPSAASSPDWNPWQEIQDEEQRRLIWWRSDSDLLGNVENGDPLPLSDLRIMQYSPLNEISADWNGSPMARLENDIPVLLRQPTDQGALYYSGILPDAGNSTLERDAIAFFVMMHRALETGAQSLSTAKQYFAGAELQTALAEYESLLSPEEVPAPSVRAWTPGAWRNGDQWIAVNASTTESQSPAVAGEQIQTLFEGVAFQQVEDQIGEENPLASEVWRAFLIFMLLALILEGWLCLPDKTPTPASAFQTPFPRTES